MGNLALVLYEVTFTVVLLFAIFLAALGVVSLLAPAKAKNFLLGFAASAFTHYVEMGLRLLVGGSIILQAPYVQYPAAFTVVGWMVICTTAVLILLPWKWHRRFAETAVPRAINYLPVIGIVSLTLGTVLVMFLLRM